MWRTINTHRLQRFATLYDIILDLSPYNAPVYDFLPPELHSKIRFGPHIFPGRAISPRSGTKPPLFFGWSNPQQQKLLQELVEKGVATNLPKPVFGTDLKNLLDDHVAVLNVHFNESVYTEYPRFLKAYLLGKPLVSEPLSAPLVEGKHYYALNAVPTKEKTREIFKNLSKFAAEHDFQRFLQSIVTPGKPANPANESGRRPKDSIPS